MSIVTGKALVVITSNGEYMPSVHAFIQSARGGEYAHDCAHDELPMMIQLYGLPGLKCFKKTPEGETVRASISFTLVYTCDYWGECDIELEIGRCKVLRRQKAPKCRYISKKDRK